MKYRSIAAAAAVSVGIGALTAPAQAVEFIHATWVPWTHWVNGRIYTPWTKTVAKNSNGAVTFRDLPKGIGHPRIYLNAVKKGQIDLGFGVFGYEPKRFAMYQFCELPGLGDRAVASSVALARTHEKFFAKMEDKLFPGVKLLGINTHGPGMIHHSKKFIKTPADMKGQKMRTGGPIPRRIVEAWGGVSIRQPAPKSYEILSTGIADGITFPGEALESFKIKKLVPFTTYIPGGLYSSCFFWVMNKKKYDSVSAAGKKAIDDFTGETFARFAGKGWDYINDAGWKAAKAVGNKMITAPPAVVNAVKKLNEKFEAEYIAAVKKQGIDGAAVLNYYRGEVAKLQK